MKNVFLLYSLQAANYLFPLITLPYLSRVLGPVGFGEVGFATSFIAYFTILSDYGFGLSGTQAIARQQQDMEGRSRTFWSVIACKVLLAAAGGILFFTLVFVIPGFASQRLLLISAFPTVLGGILFPSWLFQGMERMAGIAVCNVVGRAVLLPLIFLLVRTRDDAWVAMLLQSGAAVATGLLSLWMIARQRLVTWVRPKWTDLRQAFGEGWHVFISAAAISLYTNSNVFVLGLIAGYGEVGLFLGADKIRLTAQSLTSPIAQSVYPRINVMMKNDRNSAFRFIQKLTLVVGTSTFVISIATIVLAGPLTQMLLGEHFLPAAGVLRWLGFSPLLVGLSNIFGVQTMLPLGMKREFSSILITSGLINLVIIVPLSCAYQAQGAAASVIVTELGVTLLMGLVIIKRAPHFLRASQR